MRAPVLGIALALFACIAGCAALRPPAAPAATVTPERNRVIAAEKARDAVAIGRSTKADVAAAFGDTQAISFDSGFEIWIYRIASDAPGKGDKRQSAPRGEFVVLFAPSGVVAKTRIRLAPLRKDEG